MSEKEDYLKFEYIYWICFIIIQLNSKTKNDILVKE